jgi:hypothetical protein
MRFFLKRKIIKYNPLVLDFVLKAVKAVEACTYHRSHDLHHFNCIRKSVPQRGSHHDIERWSARVGQGSSARIGPCFDAKQITAQGMI